MIEAAWDAGCWAVKFQLYNDKVIRGNPHYNFLRKIMLNFEKADELYRYGLVIGIHVFFSVMFPEAIDWCEEIGVHYYKVRFADNQNEAILDKLAKVNKPIFISLNDKINTSLKYGCQINYIRLFCSPKYPSYLNDYWSFLQKYMRGWGVSDHTPDLAVLQIARETNRPYFEKHVCFDKNCLEAEWSVTFQELKEVLNYEKLLD